MASQRAGECLADLGSEDAKRRLVGEYLALVGRRREAAAGGRADGIPIDSAGPSDSCRLPVTAAGNHDGQAGEEVRLTCVARSDAGLPLLFRHVAGNVIDVSTVTRTIAGPGAMGVDTRFAVPDAGYHANADALMGARAPISARTGPNPGAHGEVVAGHLDGLEARENAVTRDGRLVYARCVPVGIGSRGYTYLCLDSAMRREPGRDAARRAAEGGLSGAEAHGPVAPGACLRSPAPGGWPGGSGSPLPRPRPRREGLRDRQAGRQGPARLRPDGGDPRGAPARVPRGHCGGQDDVGRAGLAQDLARGRVDAGDPARAARDRVRWAARYHRVGQEDERGAQGLWDQVPGRHQAVSCGLRKCRKLRLIFP